jgi:CheY-like chemotaxis protein
MSTKRIVIFDDSRDALRRFREIFSDVDVELLTFTRPTLNLDMQTALIAFQPDLIIADVIGTSRMDGLHLFAQLRTVRYISGTPPMIVCSKIITNSPTGQAEKDRILREHGVVAAFGKLPTFPSAEQFLQFIRRGQ